MDEKQKYDEQLEEHEFLCGKSRIYSDLATEVYKCNRCDLGCDGPIDGYDPHVMGQGNPDSGIMFVAEAPGIQETIHNQPLTSTGSSGNLYEKVLKALGFKDREDVYTTNVVLCRPPGNRDPEPWEMLKCMPFLVQQVKLVEPKLVVTFGRFAAQTFLGNFKITQEHGVLRKSEQFGVDVFPLYHPSYVKSYSRNRMGEFKTDVKMLKRLIIEMGLV